MLSGFGLRPSFRHVLDLEVEEARGRIIAGVRETGSRCELRSFPGFISLRVPPEDRRFWSPRLHLSLEPDAGGGTVITGTYGPNASMWSSFLYGYLLVGSVGLFSGILGYCQWSLGMSAWGLWIFWVMAGLVAAMYLMARTGRKLGASQTFHLHEIYQQAAGCEVEVH